jgi:hypothetical protein
MLDVLVTWLPRGDAPVTFPQVRGYYLTKHLARSGLRAEFRQLPLVVREQAAAKFEFRDVVARTRHAIGL